MNINDKIAKRLENIIDTSGQKLNSICRVAQVNQPAAHKFITRNQERIALEDLIKFANFFGVPIQYFWNDENIPTPSSANEDDTKDYDYIKFYDVLVSAGNGIQAGEENSRMLPVEKKFLHDLGYAAEMLSVVIVQGDSMEPTLRSGDRVIIFIPKYPHDFIPGIYVIRDTTGVKVKRLDNDKDGSLEVASDNKYYKTRTYAKEEVESGNITIIGRVIGKIGKM